MPVTRIKSKWSSGDLVFYPETDDTGAINIGDGTTDCDFKVFLSASTKYVLFDVGNALLTLEDVDLKLGDNDILQFGDASGGDVSIKWNATNLVVLPAADDTGIIQIGDGTTDMDVRVYLSASTKYVEFDVGNALLTLEDVDLHLGDNDILQFGDATGGDVSLKWNATNLVILPAADDTGAIYFGDGTTDMDVRFTLGAAGDYVEFDVGAKALELVGDARLDLSGATVASANTDGGVIKAGTSVAPITEDTANMKFVSMYFDDGATSGEAVGIYDRLYVTGAGGEGIALRSFCSVTDVAAGNARGAHVSLSFGTSGSVTGLGTALETTLHIPSGGGLAGTVSSIKAAINADGANSDPAGSQISVFNVVAQGNATGMQDLDTDVCLFDFQGWTAGAGSLCDTTANAATGDATIKIRWPDGSVKYLLVADDAN